ALQARQGAPGYQPRAPARGRREAVMKSQADGRFSVFQLLRVLRRRKYYILLPVLLVTPAVFFYIQKLPERFRTHALVSAEQSLPAALESRTAVVNVQEQMRAIRETIFSPAVLESVIREFNLYDLASGDRNASLAAMKSRISIQV